MGGRDPVRRCGSVGGRGSETKQPSAGREGDEGLMVARRGVEPRTFHFSGGRSYQLSYLASNLGPGSETEPGPTFGDPDGT